MAFGGVDFMGQLALADSEGIGYSLAHHVQLALVRLAISMIDWTEDLLRHILPLHWRLSICG